MQYILTIGAQLILILRHRIRKGGGRGKRIHKGRSRTFTQPEELAVAEQKERREREWRKQHGVLDDDDEEDNDNKKGATENTASRLSANSSDELSAGDHSSEEEAKVKGVEHLIEIENPNRLHSRQSVKISEVDVTASFTSTLSRREREEVKKQEEKKRYQQLHVEGKTEEARADLARLAIIRKERQDAARRKEEERKEKDAKSMAARKRG